ncbi:hypothetical protein Tco_0383852, partial [Tanacetum coccineum]
MDHVGQDTDIFLNLVRLFLLETSDRTLVPVLGNVGYSVLHGIAWAASGVVVLTWEFHH